MNEQPMQQTVNPLHVMEDGQLVSAMTLARDNGNNDRFVILRDEVMYRLRLSHQSNWHPVNRIERNRKPSASKSEHTASKQASSPRPSLAEGEE